MKISMMERWNQRPGNAGRLAAAAMLAALQVAMLLAAPVAHARINLDPGDEEGGGGGAGTVGPPPYVFPTDGFSWSAPNRYNGWTSAWHEAGGTAKAWQLETYDDNYVNPKTWYLYLQGCQSQGDYDYDNFPDLKNDDGDPMYPKPSTRYQWKWNGKTRAYSTDCYTVLDFPAQGNYWVELSVMDADGAVDTYSMPVKVEDYLVVVLGDSSASGEGAVDDPIYPELITPYEQNANWVDDRCHRSANAGGAQAAALLEAADPHTSVTFLSFACSGATLDTMRYRSTVIDILDPYETVDGYQRGTGITGAYQGMEPPPSGVGPVQVPGQVNALNYALTGHLTHPPRPVDTLIAAGGINDVRFADLVAVCVLETLCHLAEVGPDDLPLSAQFDQDLENVVPGWEKLGQQLDSFGIQVRENMKLALEYPGFFESDSGLQCPQLFDDITFLGYWEYDEIGVAEAVWAPKLNDAVAEGADHAGFQFVEGIADDFKKHGMCANDRYINTATDSVNTQGNDHGEVDDDGQGSTTGTAHPNKKGYAVYAQRILDHMEPLLLNSAPTANEDEVNAVNRYSSQFNVLKNDTDPDGDPLSARLLQGPQHGNISISRNGDVVYKAFPNFVGSDSFTYEASDGEFTVESNVDITVAPLTVQTTEVLYGTTTTIGGMLGGIGLDPPYLVVFDKPLRPRRGLIAQIPGEAAVQYTAPDTPRRRRIKLPFTVYSEAEPPSTDGGKSVRGVLQIRVNRN